MNAAGSRRASSVGPASVSTSRPGPPASISSWRHRPQGSRKFPSPLTTLTAARRAAAGGVQGGHQAALRAQGQAVGGVLYVAAHDDAAVAGLPGGAHPQP